MISDNPIAWRAGDAVRKTAQLIIEGRAAKTSTGFIETGSASCGSVIGEIRAGFDHLSQPGWCLVTGQWITGWASIEDVHEVEVLAGETLIHRARLNRRRPEIAARFNLPEDAFVAFSDQVDLSDVCDYTGVFRRLRWAQMATGERCESCFRHFVELDKVGNRICHVQLRSTPD